MTEIVASVRGVPATRMLCALFTLGIMPGAIFVHVISPLGIDLRGDGGQLFKQACPAWLCSAFVLASYRSEGVSTPRQFGLLPKRMQA